MFPFRPVAAKEVFLICLLCAKSARSGVRSYGSSIGHSPSSYTLAATSSGLSSSTADGATIQSHTTNSSPSTTIRSRSSSAIASYRSVNVAQLNQQARERAERDRKSKGASGSKPSPSYAQFWRSVTTRSELSAGKTDFALNNAGPPPAPTDVQRYSSSYAGYKPTATVQPFEDRAVATVQFGFTGLRNIGNTCFMNATLQMLINNIELKTYFLDRHYKLDVNTNNPLGFRGRLADAFGDFMRLVWNCQNRAVETDED
ncbi:hypothetical protein KIN20_035459 [Parelaphostrongylus tenuis]|uniref:ubiquitinyl hydrolase 1 n=1 Tax=Parelaphostrongylus tenuis TaxID=148309 RepID=A0AAD5RB67_PARTN|nr:hypothetical protein KIN20_035459 [Parelaphostrongylus tenuis]